MCDCTDTVDAFACKFAIHSEDGNHRPCECICHDRRAEESPKEPTKKAQMKTKTGDGGPAFPTVRSAAEMGTSSDVFWKGLSLRDYFAAKAMQTIIPINPFKPLTEFEAEATREERSQEKRDHYQRWFEGITYQAYRFADTMLAERGKP